MRLFGELLSVVVEALGIAFPNGRPVPSGLALKTAYVEDREEQFLTQIETEICPHPSSLVVNMIEMFCQNDIRRRQDWLVEHPSAVAGIRDECEPCAAVHMPVVYGADRNLLRGGNSRKRTGGRELLHRHCEQSADSSQVAGLLELRDQGRQSCLRPSLPIWFPRRCSPRRGSARPLAGYPAKAASTAFAASADSEATEGREHSRPALHVMREDGFQVPFCQPPCNVIRSGPGSQEVLPPLNQNARLSGRKNASRRHRPQFPLAPSTSSKSTCHPQTFCWTMTGTSTLPSL